ncbi:hypothetical protein [Mesorhizobium xinjiangense]|uniref:hypothetical protein n=1 Tax=Mesorhizobium xinjiangense TaxID=2678685 RepID=UPI0012ED4D3F|nr:hypothetical protein [Mesorhizobium xinjiangense]
MYFKIWGYEFDHLPEGYIGALTTELTLLEMEKRGCLQIADDGRVRGTTVGLYPVMFSLQIAGDILAAVRVERSDTDVLLGRVNFFDVRDLTWRNDNSTFDCHRPLAQVEFLISEDFQWSTENLLLSSDIFVKEEASERLLRNLIVATGADSAA